MNKMNDPIKNLTAAAALIFGAICLANLSLAPVWLPTLIGMIDSEPDLPILMTSGSIILFFISISAFFYWVTYRILFVEVSI